MVVGSLAGPAAQSMRQWPPPGWMPMGGEETAAPGATCQAIQQLLVPLPLEAATALWGTSELSPPLWPLCSPRRWPPRHMCGTNCLAHFKASTVEYYKVPSSLTRRPLSHRLRSLHPLGNLLAANNMRWNCLTWCHQPAAECLEQHSQPAECLEQHNQQIT